MLGCQELSKRIICSGAIALLDVAKYLNDVGEGPGVFCCHVLDILQNDNVCLLHMLEQVKEQHPLWIIDGMVGGMENRLREYRLLD